MKAPTIREWKGAGIGGSPTLTRQHNKPARFTYELRTSTGAVLQGNDHLDSLLKYLGDKIGVVVVRTRDSEVVARSPESA